MLRRIFLLSFVLLFPAAGFCQEAAQRAFYIDDEKFMRSFEKALLKLADDGKGAARGKDLHSQLGRKTCDIRPAPPSAAVLAPEELYTGCSGGVMSICTAFKSQTTGGWEAGEPATAWVLTPDGVMVTNYHVFEGAEKDEVFGVMNREGGFFPVTEILAGDKHNDVAIFKIHAKNLQPLAVVGGDESVGKKVAVISHPDQQFYTFTQGHITRYAREYDDPSKPPVKYMCISADFARGSSGGPVLNDRGAVVGMVSSTRTTYYGEKNKDPDDFVQMIVKFCIPAESIRAILKPTPVLASKPPPEKTDPPKAQPFPPAEEVKPAVPVPEPVPPPPPKAEPIPEPDPTCGQP